MITEDRQGCDYVGWQGDRVIEGNNIICRGCGREIVGVRRGRVEGPLLAEIRNRGVNLIFGRERKDDGREYYGLYRVAREEIGRRKEYI